MTLKIILNAYYVFFVLFCFSKNKEQLKFWANMINPISEGPFQPRQKPLTTPSSETSGVPSDSRLGGHGKEFSPESEHSRARRAAN